MEFQIIKKICSRNVNGNIDRNETFTVQTAA